MSTSEPTAEELRHQLTSYLRAQGYIRTTSIEQAFDSVPRHVFVPGADLQKAYSDTYILTKMQGNMPLSSSSQPAIMAIMLEALALQPGQNVLEIGAGTGYNAALLAHIVGEKGQVTTVDIDEDIVQVAREHLDTAGYPQVRVIHSDGVYGYPQNAPYDCIILTACAANIPVAWLKQLKSGGRLVVPFKLTELPYASIHSPALSDQILLIFERRGDILVTVASSPVGFMPMRGISALPSRSGLQIVPGNGFFTLLKNNISAEIISTLFQENYEDEQLLLTINDLEVGGLRLWLALWDTAYCELYGQEQVLQKDSFTPLMRLPDTPLTTLGLCEQQQMALLIRLPEEAGNTSSTHLIIRTFGKNRGVTRQLYKHIMAWERAGRPFRWGARNWLSEIGVRVALKENRYKAKKNELSFVRFDTRITFSW